jgi:uncharacterized lipoprotein YddW (UPF0748 family)
MAVPANASDYHRVIWVTRWDYKSAEDVRKIMKNVRDLGANEVFFQIRGNGTVFYHSALEPWAGELSGDPIGGIGMNPGWDPMAVAIEEARKNQLKIHAWLNVFPGWRGEKSPPHANQLWVKQPGWFIVDQNGQKLIPRETSYGFLSPGIPAVRNHIAAVFGEVAKKYPTLDGLHMDYVRYPALKEYGPVRDFSYDKTSVDLYRKKYNKVPKTGDPSWIQFKQENVTATIRQIREAIQKVNPTMELTGTFMAEVQAANEQAGQCPLTWLEEGLVDWVVPMVYKKNAEEFEGTLDLLHRYLGSAWDDRVVVGMNIDFNTVIQIETQLNIAYERENGGEALFAYSTVFQNHVPTKKMPTIQSLWREQKLKDLLQIDLKTTSAD